MTIRSSNNQFVERSLRRCAQTTRELQDELRITSDQLVFLESQAQEKELRAMVAETANAALEHHEAQRSLEVIQKHHRNLLLMIADHQLRQDQLLDKLGS